MRLIACLVLGWLCLSGCANPAPGDPALGKMIYLPGVGGPEGFDRAMVAGLQKGGIKAQTEVYDWTGSRKWLDALAAVERNHAEARKIAGQIADYARSHPGAPVYLVGMSGGAAVAVWALEALPDDIRIERAILLAPAISPGYDLSRALRHISGELHAFSSRGDFLVLGMGTRLNGTMDRCAVESAGRVGFALPPHADRSEYAKLIRHEYQGNWLRFGVIGNHSSILSPDFAEFVLAPLLMRGLAPEAPPAPSLVNPDGVSP